MIRINIFYIEFRSNGHVSIAFVMIILYSGFQSLPVPLYESAAIDGASPLQELFHITIPLLKNLLLITFVFRLMDTLKVFDIIYVLTRGGPGTFTENISIYGVNQTFDYLYLGYAATGTMVFLFAVIIVFTLIFRYTKIFSI